MNLKLFVFLILFSFLLASVRAEDLWEHELLSDQNEVVSLSRYKDSKAVLIVNVASNCGYTYTNYKELEDLYDKYKEVGA